MIDVCLFWVFSNLDVCWILSDPNRFVEIVFMDVQTEERFDVVRLYEGKLWHIHKKSWLHVNIIQRIHNRQSTAMVSRSGQRPTFLFYCCIQCGLYWTTVYRTCRLINAFSHFSNVTFMFEDAIAPLSGRWRWFTNETMLYKVGSEQ